MQMTCCECNKINTMQCMKCSKLTNKTNDSHALGKVLKNGWINPSGLAGWGQQRAKTHKKKIV